MQLQILAVAVAALLMIGIGSASAHTTIIAPPESHFPYQQWVDEAKVPTPDVTLTVIEEPCFGEDPVNFAWACTKPATYTIWDASPISQRETFLHELGHNFDYYVLPEWARERFRRLVADETAWASDPNGPNESFAESYSRCGITGPRFQGDPNLSIKGNGASIQRETFRRICRMIKGSYLEVVTSG